MHVASRSQSYRTNPFVTRSTQFRPSKLSYPCPGRIALWNLINRVIALLESFIDTPFLCSVLSYFCRTENTFHHQEFLDQRLLAFDKEISAALQYTGQAQILDYRALFGIGRVNLHPNLSAEMPYRLVRLFQAGIRGIKSRFSHYRVEPLLPAYNTRKNVGYATTIRYFQCVNGGDYLPSRVDYSTTTTLSLLRLYFNTGEKISGPLEVREAWFFNDLKPRVYYCLGGDAFWAGLYIQDIANILIKILPSTHPHTRFDVTRIRNVSPHEILITYDYSCFTSSLGELKHFLFWLAEELRGVPVSALDLREGLRSVDLGVLLHEYNDLVNNHQMFSVERFFPAMDGVTVYRQGRNGSLGVKGNIALSTTLHGISLAAVTGSPDDDCCVGDDALANILYTTLDLFIQCTNHLGEINPSKFITISPPTIEDPNPAAGQFKFLKRPLNLDYFGKPYLGTLDFFPSIAGKCVSHPSKGRIVLD